MTVRLLRRLNLEIVDYPEFAEALRHDAPLLNQDVDALAAQTELGCSLRNGVHSIMLKPLFAKVNSRALNIFH